MKYLMLVVADPSLEEKDDEPISIEEWVDETYGTGKATDGDRLRPPPTRRPSAAATAR